MAEKLTTQKVKSEIDRAKEQFDSFDAQVKDLTLDRMNEAPKKEAEQQTQLSQEQVRKAPEVYLKPKRSINSQEKFNEKYRSDYNYQKEYVHFIAENKEIIGEKIELWTKPFAGMPAEYWEIPVNKPLWAPRYVAERIKGCKYHRLTMQESMSPDNYIGDTGVGGMYGRIVVDSTVNRIDAHPVSEKKSVFMGASNF